MTTALSMPHEPLPAIDYMPGGWMELRFAPALQWPILHKSIRPIHAILSELLGGLHDPLMPRFVLFPHEGDDPGIGWGVYVPDEEAALRIAGRTHQVDWCGDARLLRVGPMRRWKAPAVSSGHYSTLMLRTLTPVVIRRGGRHGLRDAERYHEQATESGLLSTIGAWLPQRCGLHREAMKVRCQFLANDTRQRKVRMDYPLGIIGGWHGTLVLKASPGAHWLLKAAEMVGLGGRTAYGFGRVTVQEMG